MSKSVPSVRLSLTYATFGALAWLSGCAAPRTAATTTTTTTAANAPTSDEAAPAPRSAEQGAAAATLPGASPAGDLACRTRDAFGVTTELFITWSGDTGTGVLRTVAPSGETRERRVHTERYKDTIVADDPGQTDLVKHAAMIGTQGGKRHVRLADADDSWSRCE